MSSDEENASSLNKSSRKAHRPCDVCRRKKRTGDGQGPCSRCVKHGSSCTYELRAMQRTTATSSSYVQSLEKRLKTVESLLRDSHSGDIIGTLHSSQASAPKDGPAVELISHAIRRLNSPFPEPHSDDLAFVEISQDLDSLSLDSPGSNGFQGKSSQAMLVRAAVNLKDSHATPSSAATQRCVAFASQPWSITPWDDAPSRPAYAFPDADLAISLISLYFDYINTSLPLLHRPIFESAFAANLHLLDDGFGGTLLLVCALGARYSADQRVHATSSRSPGWEWFSQVRLASQTLCGEPTLYDLQCYCLAVQFLDRISGPRVAWKIVGFGLRLAQDIGAHRLKLRARTIRPEEELEKRAYWLLLLFDSQLSGALGRTIAIQSHDFDLDLPVRCDDEYWEASSRHAAFCQPPNTPSLVDFLISMIKLNRISSFTLKILYSSNRIKTLMGLGDEMWQQKLAVEFDSALNAWLDSVPGHLQWDPACPNDVFFDQSAALYCSYYFLRILIHRPFIPAVRNSATPTTFPSLSICNTAARACSHVAAIHHRRRPNNPLVFGQTALFTAGIVLLLNIWGGTRTGRVHNTDLSDVHQCITVLRAHKTRWPSTGPLLDTLEQLAKVDQVPPARSPRDDYEPSPFVTGPVDGISSHMPKTVRHPQQRAYDPRLYDEVMAGHFVGPVGEEPALPPRVRYPKAYHDISTVAAATAPARPPSPPTSITTTSFAASLGNPKYFVDEEPALAPRVSPAVPSSHDAHATFDPMDTDTVAMWSAAPTGFEVSDWDLYLSNIANMMQ
ncbi:fungal-specific transcription factor domain-containing protein [Mycena vulgaris]|nr:fungal-specific transcription factor domain-containing protein [Mycena vulgaris]